MKKAFLLIIFLALLAAFSVRVYRAETVSGMIVDANSGNAIHDAIIVIKWDLVGGIQNNYKGSLRIIETTSDIKGRFQFEAWGPELTFSAYVRETEPAIFVYKKGYYTGIFSNHGFKDSGYVLTSEWNGKALPISKANTDKTKYHEQLSRSLISDFYSALLDNPCRWTDFPKLTLFSLRAAKQFEALHIPHAHPSRENLSQQGRCKGPFDPLKVE